MNGIFNIYKEENFTSMDVVAVMRGILKQKKIGHTGTLDPMATGVLPVCVGSATKLCDMFTDRSKEYEAVIHLGISTDTEDMTGNVLASDDGFNALSDEEIISAVKSFIGLYMQVPPMYSALKVNGRKLYDYARAGITIDREPRPVTIYDISDIRVEKPLVYMKVACSKGTYIRTLCVDIGKKLNVNACMESLKRVRVGNFGINEAITLKQLEAIVNEGRLSQVMLDIDTVFAGMDKGFCPKIYDKYIYNGNKLKKEWISLKPSETFDSYHWNETFPGCISMYDEGGVFIGIYKYNQDNDEYVPEKLFLNSK